MKFAITACGGKLGSEIVKAAIDAVGQDQVVGLARTPSKASWLGIEVRPGDYDSPDELEESLNGVDSMLLVSGMAPPDQRTGQHQNVINAAKKAGVAKIVYTSVQGAEHDTAFSPVIQSNRQTEKDVQNSGLEWAIGRNGIYIEPDVEYIETYKKLGAISNSAGDGKCGYTTRSELAYAYARMLSEEKHNGQVYNLHGESITQQQLASYLNLAFGTDLTYKPLSIEEYRRDRVAELGEFIGNVIAGIYEGILSGASDNQSDYSTAAGRAHQSWDDYFGGLKS